MKSRITLICGPLQRISITKVILTGMLVALYLYFVSYFEYSWK